MKKGWVLTVALVACSRTPVAALEDPPERDPTPTPKPAACFTVEPDPIEFLSPLDIDVAIRGPEGCVVEAVEINGDGFSLRAPPLVPIMLEGIENTRWLAAEVVDLAVPRTGALTLIDGDGVELVVPLESIMGVDGCLKSREMFVDFGQVDDGETAEIEIYVDNDCPVDAVLATGEGEPSMVFGAATAFPITVPSRSSVPVVVTFTPSRDFDMGQLVMFSNDAAANPLVVLLIGHR